MSEWDKLSWEERLAFWKESERLLTDLLDACSGYLTPHQNEMAKELLDHNEHQLALEFLFDYLDEKTTDYPKEVLDKFRVLDARLHLTGNRDLNSLGRAYDEGV
jgi:hypothetical protein